VPEALLRRPDDGVIGGSPEALRSHPEIGEPWLEAHVDQLRNLSGEWLDQRSAEIIQAFDAHRSSLNV
jgi:hypothetical protein